MFPCSITSNLDFLIAFLLPTNQHILKILHQVSMDPIASMKRSSLTCPHAEEVLDVASIYFMYKSDVHGQDWCS